MTEIDSLVPGFTTALQGVPGTFDAHRRLGRSLAAGELTARQRCMIGLVVAQQLRCEYCLWAYTRLAEKNGLSAEDIVFARAGSALDRRDATMARLAHRMISGGVLLRPIDCDVTDAILVGDSAIAEIAAQVAYTVLNCYVIQGLAPGAKSARQSRRAA